MPLAPEYAAMFEQLAGEEPAPPLWEMTPAQGREMYRAMRPLIDELPIGSVENQTIHGSQGQIPLRVYRPATSGPHGVLMYFHGGGWVIGDLDTGDAVCRQLAEHCDVIVISVDYRMAPEDIYPAAVNDCYEATCWAAENMQALNGNGKLGVTGESAGGNLSAVMCLKARDEGGPKINFQCLLYPVTDCDMNRGSYAENGEGYLLELKSMVWFWDNYCPDSAVRSEPYASPIRAGNLGNLPPALVVTAEFDPLRDEGMAYAEALDAAGTEATAICYDGLVHDFFATAVMFECSKAAFNATVSALKQHLN
ncbi:MAG: alpha/beta hydrolase [Pseudomonadota bacterium]